MQLRLSSCERCELPPFCFSIFLMKTDKNIMYFAKTGPGQTYGTLKNRGCFAQGAVLAMWPPGRRVTTPANRTKVFALWTAAKGSAGNGSGTWYEDDGETLDYRDTGQRTVLFLPRNVYF